jgi:NAD(P)-dependent dehydrogenase (short-subunit alcohol dehydrogenase family)
MSTLVALVTGANKGIGLEIARQLARLQHTVLIGARDPQRGEAAASELRSEGLDARFVRLDVTDQRDIADAVRMIAATYGRLDVLVNNAAIAQDTAPPSQTSIDLMRRTYETNVFGLLAVTQAMLPLLRKAPAARIVNMSSGAGSFARTTSPDWRVEWATLAYNSSKSAVNAITVQLATELRDTPIKINAANPGYTATEMNQFRGERTVQQAAIAPVRLATLPADGPSGGFFEENGVVPW